MSRQYEPGAASRNGSINIKGYIKNENNPNSVSDIIIVFWTALPLVWSPLTGFKPTSHNHRIAALARGHLSSGRRKELPTENILVRAQKPCTSRKAHVRGGPGDGRNVDGERARDLEMQVLIAHDRCQCGTVIGHGNAEVVTRVQADAEGIQCNLATDRVNRRWGGAVSVEAHGAARGDRVIDQVEF
jgi:hypothetical protein